MVHQKISALDLRTTIQTFFLILLLGLLALTSFGSSGPMMFVTLIALFLLFIWFLADRKIWLASVSGLAFILTLVLTANSLF